MDDSIGLTALAVAVFLLGCGFVVMRLRAARRRRLKDEALMEQERLRRL